MFKSLSTLLIPYACVRSWALMLKNAEDTLPSLLQNIYNVTHAKPTTDRFTKPVA